MIDDMVPDAQAAIAKHLDAEARKVATAIGKGEPWEDLVDGDKLLAVMAKAVYEPAYRPFAERAYTATEGQVKKWSGETISAWMQDVLRIIGEAGTRKIKGMTDTTRLRIRHILEEAQAEGLGVREAARRIRTRMPEINITRSERIARTELNATANAGTLGGVEQAAADLGIDMEKVWYTSQDYGRMRDSHKTMHGQSVPLNGLFITGAGNELQHPGDFNAPAGEVVNCLCTMLFEAAP